MAQNVRKYACMHNLYCVFYGGAMAEPTEPPVRPFRVLSRLKVLSCAKVDLFERMIMDVKTRMEAAQAGEKKYRTGKPCSNGHDSPRYTSTGICCRCNVDAAKRYSGRVQLTVKAKLQGHFVYPLHPDDHASALAYCQALDLSRGRVPHVVAAPTPFGEISAEQAAMIAATRASVIGGTPTTIIDPRMLKP